MVRQLFVCLRISVPVRSEYLSGQTGPSLLAAQCVKHLTWKPALMKSEALIHKHTRPRMIQEIC